MSKILFVVLAVMLAGCATQKAGLSERDKILYEGRIEDLEAAQTRQITKISSLESRIRQLEDSVALLSRKAPEAREVVRIEPDVPTVSANFDYRQGVDAIDEDAYQDIIIDENKKRAYFGSSESRSGSSSSSSGGGRRVYENVVPGSDRLPGMNGSQSQSAGDSPLLAYQEGIDLYRQEKYVEARAKFEKFLASKPDESYVDNALYWIGECFYGQGLYAEAASYFHKIIQQYPNANKVPDALLKVSLTYQKLGKNDSALEMLRYLMDAFPGTEAARIAKEKYQALTHS